MSELMRSCINLGDPLILITNDVEISSNLGCLLDKKPLCSVVLDM